MYISVGISVKEHLGYAIFIILWLQLQLAHPPKVSLVSVDR